MATSQQTTLGRFGVHEYELGDLLRQDGSKLHLTECPFCAMNPNRPRYLFERQESRPDHFRTCPSV